MRNLWICSLALCSMTLLAQDSPHNCIDPGVLKTGVITSTTAACAATMLVDPTFKTVRDGWEPICPKGMELIREVPTQCFWGTKAMPFKSSQGEYYCRSIGAKPVMKPCDGVGTK